MIYPYPEVRDEYATLKALRAGASIARIGDGELKLIHGAAAMREPANQKLARELLDILQRPVKGLLPGIPTLDPKGPKHVNWLKHAVRFCQVLVPGVTYYSAFITRPDSAPWISTNTFARGMQSLWTGKRVALVAEPDVAIVRTVSREPGAPAELVLITCPHRETYTEIDRIESEVARAAPQIALLSAGPAASCLAQRLCRRGIQAVDIGSAGQFLARCLWPQD